MSQTRLDTPDLIDALAGPQSSADAAGRALLARGHAAVREMLAAFHEAPTAVRRRLAFLLGKARTKGQHTDVEAALQRALGDPDWKVRRNAAISLGSSGASSVLPAVKAALEREVDPTVRPSLMLAFGQLASSSDLPWIDTWQTATEEERRARDTVRARLIAQSQPLPTLATSLEIPEEAGPELWCRHGLADILADETKQAGLAVRLVDPERIAIAGPVTLARLLQPRTALFPALVLRTTVQPHDPAGAGRLFASSAVAREMKRLTSSDQVVYRLTLSQPIEGFPRRRDWIDAFSEAASGLTNSATGYAWELIARAGANGVLLAARPASAPDERFAYRRRDVPASLHPTLAAAAARLLPINANDIILDPFCGSGTLLAERALSGPYTRIVGIDHHEHALAAARENLHGFVRGLELVRADYSTGDRFAPVTQILTNPPYGQRVGDRHHARRLQGALDALAARILAPRGYLAVFRPADFPGPSQLRVIKRIRIDAGGLAVVLWMAQKA